MQKIMSTIAHWYDLQTEYYRESRLCDQMRTEMLQAKHDYLEAGKAVVEYSSTLPGIYDRLFRNSRKIRTLEKEEAAKKAGMDLLTRDWKRQAEKTDALHKEAAALPEREELKILAAEHPGTLQYQAEREYALCREMLKPKLEDVLQGLEAYRQQLRGGNSDRIMDPNEIHQACTAHIAPAKESHVLLLRLREAGEILQEPLSFGAYFENPAGFIESAAARHNRLDRINEAISQTTLLQKAMQ